MSAPLTLRPHSVDELLWHMGCIAARTDAPAWDRRFATDMAKLGRRRNWKPTPKQEATMRRIVADRLSGCALIDHDDA